MLILDDLESLVYSSIRTLYRKSCQVHICHPSPLHTKRLHDARMKNAHTRETCHCQAKMRLLAMAVDETGPITAMIFPSVRLGKVRGSLLLAQLSLRFSFIKA